jgi:hypothetical protein
LPRGITRSSPAAAPQRPNQHQVCYFRLEARLDLVESGLGAGSILGAAAPGAVCAAEANRTNDIVAGHDRYCTRPREDVLVRREPGLQGRVFVHLERDLGGRLLHIIGEDSLFGAELAEFFEEPLADTSTRRTPAESTTTALPFTPASRQVFTAVMRGLSGERRIQPPPGCCCPLPGKF